MIQSTNQGDYYKTIGGTFTPTISTTNACNLDVWVIDVSLLPNRVHDLQPVRLGSILGGGFLEKEFELVSDFTLFQDL